MAVTSENTHIVDGDVSSAERLRRAGACTEMAEVLLALGRHSTVPDVQWMAQVAADELAKAARSESDPRPS